MRRLLACVLACGFTAFCCAALPQRALARVERYAVVIANDRGDTSDSPLRYATNDATRVSDVMRELGGFAPVNMVLLRDENVDTVRGTLIAVNERIRQAMMAPDVQALLFVYYSGHADAESLHLGNTRFAIRELTQLVGGSAASFRLVVLDACRSGVLTRAKGGRLVAPFAILETQPLPSNGLAFLTASAANEDAQESDDLRGSFFTHAWVSGLLGAADSDHDGAVVLEEAYQYAYEATLRSTSRTFAGTQHPTFRYDFRGQGRLVLTQPDANAAARAHLYFPAGVGFLIFRDDDNGTVTAEVNEHDSHRMLSVRPGSYFVRGRGQDVLYEGQTVAVAGSSTVIELSRLSRIEYAHLVRKGGSETTLAHAMQLGARARTPLANSESPCIGGFLGYGLDLQHFGLRARFSACTSSGDNAVLETTTNAYDLEADAYHAWDWRGLSAQLGLGAGATWFTQAFAPDGRADTRNSVAPYVSLALGATYDLGAGFHLGADVSAETHFIALQSVADQASHTEVTFGVRPSLFVGKWFR